MYFLNVKITFLINYGENSACYKNLFIKMCYFVLKYHFSKIKDNLSLMWISYTCYHFIP